MFKIFAMIVALLMLSACSATERGAATGAAIGGVGGAVVGGTKGAAIGAIGGAAVGALIGRTQDGRCRYRNSRGRVYTAAC